MTLFKLPWLCCFFPLFHIVAFSRLSFKNFLAEGMAMSLSLAGDSTCWLQKMEQTKAECIEVTLTPNISLHAPRLEEASSVL